MREREGGNDKEGKLFRDLWDSVVQILTQQAQRGTDKIRETVASSRGMQSMLITLAQVPNTGLYN